MSQGRVWRSAGIILASAVSLVPIAASADPHSRPHVRAPECKRSQIERSVRDFHRAFNRGDAAGLESTVAAEPAFRVYSQTQRYGQNRDGFFTSEDRDRVIRHLMRRQARGDGFRRPVLDLNGYDRHFEICNVGFQLERRIAGGPLKSFSGKGALDQRTGDLAVWNIGGEVPSGSQHQLRDCSDTSEGRFQKPFSSPDNLVAGPLALVGAGGTPEFTPSVGGQKFPLIVKPGHRVTVAVPRAAADFARLAYPGVHEFDDAPPKITFVACRGGELSDDSAGRAGIRRRFWSGFVLTRSAGCVPLRISIDNEGSPRRRIIHLGVTSCP